MPGLLVEILEYLEREGPQAPGDVVAALRAPRYRVLAAFHCLEELGLAVPLYSRGSYRIYQISEAGRQLLRQAQEQGGLALALQSALEQGRPPEAEVGA
ncbi:MAG: hypothetical protein F7C34_04620 [Desulfurococcales archaeon]|nr:hypothetical protein [Desulfurococcales archaeon]